MLGIFALSLSSFQAYSISKIISFLYAYTFFGSLFILKNFKKGTDLKFPKKLEISKAEILFLFLFSCLTFYLYAEFPTKYLDGGRDQGLYAIFGVTISKTGGLNLEVPDTGLIRNIFGDSIRLDYPSISSPIEEGFSEPETFRAADFFHLFPVYLAIAYDLFGIEGIFRVNALFGTLSLCFFYLLSRRILGTWSSVFVVILYVFNSSQLWNVRATFSETLAQFLIILTGYLIQCFFRSQDRVSMFLIGIVLGLASFARVDSYILVIALASYSGFFLIYSEKYFVSSIYLFLSFFMMCILSAGYGLLYSKLYMFHLWKAGPLKLVGGLGLLSLLLIVFEIFLWQRCGSFLEKLKETFAKNKRFFRFSILAFIIALGLFAYFIRPLLTVYIPGVTKTKFIKPNSLPIFLWYVPVWLFIFLIFTFDRFLFRKKDISSAFIFFIGIFLLIAYLANPSINPDHFWASRRWMLFSIPFAILGSMIGIRSIQIRSRIWKLAFLILLGGSAFVYTIWRSKIILFQPMLQGYVEGYESFAKISPNENSFYFTTKRAISSPLRYIYGKNVFLINDSEGFLNKVPKLLELGKNVYIIQNGGFSGVKKNLKFTHISDLDLRGNFPIESVHRYPEFLYHKNLNLQFYRIEETKLPVLPEKIQFDWNPAQAGFLSNVGKIEEDGTISATRHQGSLVYGPYLTLPKGKYRIEFVGENLQKADFDVSYDKGSVSLSKLEKGDSENSKIVSFEIKNSIINDLEFRVFVEGKSGVKIKRIKLDRIL
ncbi:hypothetical protein [Leptospira neocaledonica]|uniref:hypothetical protein n=1 Tax=Leptospira neocaledonica TaxID=2023192 RepID=UPI000F655442|nr:hypothetical protein [Leptospira neocaledonica]